METSVKDRVFKNWITTVIGIVLIVYGVILIVCSIRSKSSLIEDAKTILPVLGLGWTFLMAKDTLLEGILPGLVKL